MSEHLKGLLITTFGVLLVVPDALFVRLIEAESLTIAFWRSSVAGLLILAGVLAVQGPGAFRATARTGRAGLIYVVLIGLASPGFVMAISLTSVANAVFIFSTIPVFSALFSRIFLGEPIRRRTVLTMAVVAVGLAIIAYGSGTSQISSWTGDAFALGVSATFAGALTAVRMVRATSMVPAIPVAYLLSALLVWPFAAPTQILTSQIGLVLMHGAFIACATSLMTLGPRYLSVPEVSLLLLLESVLAPLLVWAVVGENPGPWAMMGGAVVIGALVASNVLALRRWRRQ